MEVMPLDINLCRELHMEELLEKLSINVRLVDQDNYI